MTRSTKVVGISFRSSRLAFEDAGHPFPEQVPQPNSFSGCVLRKVESERRCVLLLISKVIILKQNLWIEWTVFGA